MSAEMPDLLSIALELHMNRTGASDGYFCTGERDEHLAILRERLANWRVGLRGSERFDDAVRELLSAAVAEWDVTP